jgi:V8-like Glu-specific endopeptidase
MDRSTVKSIAIGSAVAVCLVAVAAIGFLVGRTSEDEVATTPTTMVPTTTTTTSLPEPVPTTVVTTTTELELRDFPELFEDLRSAVASVDVVGCDFGSQGTAFLVNEDTAYTAWHVVEDAAQVALTVGGESVEAAVIGHDAVRDVAVLRLASSIDGAVVLPIAGEQPRVGEEVAAMGHPRGLPLALTVGRVTSMNGEFDFGGTAEDVVSNLIQTDAVVAPGSSGGPLINQRGEVIGVVILKDIAAEGLMYAGDIEGVRAELATWDEIPEPVEAAFCVGSVDLSNIDDIASEFIGADVGHSEVAALQRTFAVYTQSINSGRAEAAFGVLGPTITTNNSADAWAEGQSTSLLWDWRIRSIASAAEGLEVRSTFTSTQEPEFAFDGTSTCTRWDITHTMIPGSFRGRDFWLIDGSRATEGVPPIDCLEWRPEFVPRGNEILAPPGESTIYEFVLAGGTVDDMSLAVDLAEDGLPVTVVISLEAVDESFDPLVQIRGEFGSIVAENDDRGDGSLNSRVEYEVATSQVIGIQIRDLSDRTGGAYVLEVSHAAG